MSPPHSSSSPSSFVNNMQQQPLLHIKHHVSKMDTLAGVAIKYGVEVADIKRMNGLATDLQMFALNTLHIPLLRRHPQSPSQSGYSSHYNNASALPPPPPPRREQSSRRRHTFDSFQSQTRIHKICSGFNLNGLKSPHPNTSTLADQGIEMASAKSLARRSKSVSTPSLVLHHEDYNNNNDDSSSSSSSSSSSPSSSFFWNLKADLTGASSIIFHGTVIGRRNKPALD